MQLLLSKLCEINTGLVKWEIYSISNSLSFSLCGFMSNCLLCDKLVIYRDKYDSFLFLNIEQMSRGNKLTILRYPDENLEIVFR